MDRDQAFYEADGLPWPLLACLRSAGSPTDLEALARDMEAGRFGDVDAWLGFEQRWKSDGVTVDALIGQDAGPIDAEGRRFPGHAALWVVERDADHEQALAELVSKVGKDFSTHKTAARVIARIALAGRHQDRKPALPLSAVQDMLLALEGVLPALMAGALLGRADLSAETAHELDGKVSRIVDALDMTRGELWIANLSEKIRAMVVQRIRKNGPSSGLLALGAACLPVAEAHKIFGELMGADAALQSRTDWGMLVLRAEHHERRLSVPETVELLLKISGNGADFASVMALMEEFDQSTMADAIAVLDGMLKEVPIAQASSRQRVLQTIDSISELATSQLAQRARRQELGFLV
jgi:hypothetical protein